MDISTTTSTVNTTADASTPVQTQKTSNNDTSFKDEMKKVSSVNNEQEMNETQVNNLSPKKSEEKKVDNALVKENVRSFLDKSQKTQFEQKSVANLKEKAQTTLTKNLESEVILDQAPQNVLLGEVNVQNLENINSSSFLTNNVDALLEANRQLADITLKAESKNSVQGLKGISLDYSTIQITEDDAIFFADLVQDSEKTLQNVVSDLQSGVEQKIQEASKNVKVSSTLMNAISEAAKTNQPLRIDFDKDVSVIIKIDKDGAVNAKFIPGDKAVEEYLKQNISILRQRFDDQELSYRDLSYSRQHKQNQENNRRNNKENDHE